MVAKQKCYYVITTDKKHAVIRYDDIVTGNGDTKQDQYEEGFCLKAEVIELRNKVVYMKPCQGQEVVKDAPKGKKSGNSTTRYRSLITSDLGLIILSRKTTSVMLVLNS